LDALAQRDELHTDVSETSLSRECNSQKRISRFFFWGSVLGRHAPHGSVRRSQERSPAPTPSTGCPPRPPPPVLARARRYAHTKCPPLPPCLVSMGLLPDEVLVSPSPSDQTWRLSPLRTADRLTFAPALSLTGPQRRPTTRPTRFGVLAVEDAEYHGGHPRPGRRLCGG
jgi:hypothetical protein